jgi:hypothetical protein
MSKYDATHLMFFPSVEGYINVAKSLNIDLPTENQQDWEWEIASQVDFDKALETYKIFGDNERYLLMEIMIQIVADELSDKHIPVESSEKLSQLKELLRQSPKLHGFTVHYWSGFSEDHEWKDLGKEMLKIWNEISPAL